MINCQAQSRSLSTSHFPFEHPPHAGSRPHKPSIVSPHTPPQMDESDQYIHDHTDAPMSAPVPLSPDPPWNERAVFLKQAHPPPAPHLSHIPSHTRYTPTEDPSCRA